MMHYKKLECGIRKIKSIFKRSFRVERFLVSVLTNEFFLNHYTQKTMVFKVFNYFFESWTKTCEIIIITCVTLVMHAVGWANLYETFVTPFCSCSFFDRFY